MTPNLCGGNHPYRRANNLLATPHVGYVSRGLYENVNNISAWLDERFALNNERKLAPFRFV